MPSRGNEDRIARAAVAAGLVALVTGAWLAFAFGDTSRILPLRNPIVLAGCAVATAAPACWWLAWRRLRTPGRGAPVSGPLLRRLWLGACIVWLGLLATTWFESARVGVMLVAWSTWCAFSLARVPPAATAAQSGRVTRIALRASAALVLCELLLRAAAAIVPSPLLAQPDDSVLHSLADHAFAPGQPRFEIACNELGFFDGPFRPRAVRNGRAVAVLGDSFSASMVPHVFHYTTVAERALAGIELWNVGWPGTGPQEYQALLQRDVLPCDPDAVVVSLYLGNDLIEVRPGGAIDRTLRAWCDRDNLLLLQLPVRLWRIASEVESASTLSAPPSAAGTPDTLDVVLQRFPWLLDYREERPMFTPEAFLRVETERALAFGHIDARHFAAMTEALLAMRALAAPRPFGIVLIPDVAMVEDGLWQQIQAQVQAPLERRALPDRLLAFCRAEGIPCLDLLPKLRAVAPEADGDRHLYLLRDGHWNVRGNASGGAELAAFVRDLLR